MNHSADGDYQAPTYHPLVNRQKESSIEQGKKLSSGDLNTLSDKGPWQPVQARRNTNKHKSAAVYEPGAQSDGFVAQIDVCLIALADQAILTDQDASSGVVQIGEH